MTAIKFLFKNSRLLKYFIFSLTCVVFAMILTSCEQNPTAPNEPPKPYGYQEDIYWPSLADSPWPMYQHDPQNTGRSKYKGPQSGAKIWEYDSVSIESGIVINGNGSIIFQTGGSPLGWGKIYSINTDGSLDWNYSVDQIASGTTPLVMNDGKIISSTYIGGKIVALDPNGNELWNYNTGGYINNVNLTVGLDGSIYFVDTSRTLYSLNSNGVLLWTLKIENAIFGYGVNPSLAFSQDGKRLYITGANYALNAVDIQTQSVLWTYGNYFNVSPPVIDNRGNIYLCGKPKSDERTSLTKLDPNGDELWIKYWGDGTEPYFYPPTIDKNGNIYFGYDSLHSVTYDGVLRWKVDLFDSDIGSILSPISCDNNSVVYVPVEIDGQFSRIFAINSDGLLIWQSDLLEGHSGDSPALSDGKMFFPTYRSEKLYLIQ
ncbi:MAG: PQQ-like beta-propeller repeat protein [Ignavibacteriales bacterium]|nr:PQQ-like beta-propeller repeat protein [Ignavibacteriales bacterium]